MIEDAMFLALGFFAAMLLALACIPVLWARAMRLSRRRLEMQVPLSVAEIDAVRDGIRAEAAVSQRRLEQALETGKETSAALSTELGHRTVSLVNAERTVATLEEGRASLLTEIAGLARTGRDEEAQRVATEKALHDADAHIASLQLDMHQQREEAASLATLAEDRRVALGALDAQVAGLRVEIAGIEGEVAQLTSSLALARSSIAELTRERDTASNRALLAATRHEIVAAQLKLETERGKERDRRELAQAEARAQDIATMTQTKAAVPEPLADLKRQFHALETRLSKPPAEVTDGGNPPEDDDRALRSAIVALGDAALRELLPHDPEEADKSSPQGDAGRSGALP